MSAANDVSVVIPCFNGSRWLGEAIGSALAQTRAVEVIVVDDGSTDDSVAVARAFEPRVCVLTGPNGGPSRARNRGVERASGRFLQFLDADDLLLPGKVEACLDAGAASDEVVFTDKRFFTGSPTAPPVRGRRTLRSMLRRPPAPFPAEDPLRAALTWPIAVSPPLYPAELVRRVGGFREGMTWLEDIDLHVRMALAGARFRRLPEVLVLVRDHAGPDRLRRDVRGKTARIEGELQMIGEVRAAGRLEGSIAEVFADRLAAEGRAAWSAGFRAEARRAFEAARDLSPHPRPTHVPAYNWIARVLGLERTVRLMDPLAPVRHGG